MSKEKVWFEKPITILKEENHPIDFVFINDKMQTEFSESSPYATVSGTIMMLNEPSMSGNYYSISESENIMKSCSGIPIFEGVGKFGEHSYEKAPIGFLIGVKKMGHRIYGVARITNRALVQKLKAGLRYLFSVQGSALYQETIKIKNKIVRSLHDIRINSLQIVPFGTNVGFPSASLDRLISIQETVMLDSRKDILNFGLAGVLQSEELNKIIGEEALKLV